MAFTKADKKAKKHAKKSADAANTSALKAQKALEELQKLAATTGPVVSEGAREARARAAEFVDSVRPGIEETLRHQGERLGELSQNLGPRAEKLRGDLEEDYLPRARKTAAATSSVLGAAAAAARKEFEKGQGDIRKAALTPTKRPKKSGGAGKVLLVLGLVAAGAAAGYVAWKKTRPVEDPWAPPADFARAHYPASAGSESDSDTVSDTVGSADAGDVADALKGDDRSSDVTPKNVKVESAPSKEPASAKDSSSSKDKDSASGRVIDPVGNPEENPQDPEGRGEKRGNHRGEA